MTEGAGPQSGEQWEGDHALDICDHERLFRELVEYIREVFWVTSPDKEEMLYISPGYEEIWGRGRRQLYNAPNSWLDSIHPEDRDRVMRALPGQITGDYDIEYRVVRPSGEVRRIRDRAFPIHDDEGRVRRIAGIAEDITDHWLAEENARKLLRERTGRAAAETAERRASFLAEAGAVLTSSLDYSETLKSVASLAVRRVADVCLVDVATEDGTAMTRVAIAHRDPALKDLAKRAPHLPPGRGSPLFEAFDTGKPLLIPKVDGGWLDRFARNAEHRAILQELDPKSVIVVPLVARAHALGTITFVSTGRSFDDHDLSLAEELARRAALAVDNASLYNDALAANQAKGDFLTVMSHELRTPLNAIIGNIDLLDAEVSGPLEPEQEKQIDRIERNARHLLELIEELLLVSRVGAARERLKIEQVDLGALVRDVADEMGPRAEEARLQFQLHLPRSEVPVEIDTGKVKRILRNLVSNAIKFTPEGRVDVGASVRDGQIRLEVTDTGIGIGLEHHEKIFEPFWQVEPGTVRERGGTGLGLSIARYLARLMGGEVTVQSVLGRGSTFVVRLPSRSADERDTRESEAPGGGTRRDGKRP